MTVVPSSPGFGRAAVRRLAAALRGPLLVPGDAGYDAARRPRNAEVNERPALIAYCTDAADVAAAVNFGRDHGLGIAVRGGGHCGSGLGNCDGGLVVDLSRMRSVRVDPEARLAHAGGGATVADLDHATQQFGLVTPTGIVSTTGLAGLALDGGYGHLTRGYGLTLDNLRAVDLVLADGGFVTARADRNEDLFWAVRGGGGNFGVVTSLTLALHPLSAVVAGPTLWPAEAAADVMGFYREFLPNAPRELGGIFTFLVVPPDPAFPSALHRRRMCGVVWCYSGALERAAAAFAPIREVPAMALDGIQPLPYPALQSMLDLAFPYDLRWFWKGGFVDELTDEAVAAHVEHGSSAPTGYASTHLFPVDGAVRDVARTEAAFSHRDATWVQVVAAADPDPTTAHRTAAWATRGTNAPPRHDDERLTWLKARYDPTNLFRHNRNIAPASPGFDPRHRLP